ncbi:response regulator transcription factor [Leucobacter komagatae]|uniref:DNA-binding response OmpR family regulator n=1 Tax=Leucobacter komagatae TaxID=55969 RepID=A0A0D0H8T7_9MICO|nr:response regulator transcription factor [Leucobacter komagatae]KIP53600.1 hypothetical protein SD72_02835 [Leucobacter komagatae]
MRILVVEDEVDLAASIEAGLRSEGHQVQTVFDGASALQELESSRFDVAILDRDLPIVHGDVVAKSIASTGSPVRVLMLTAASDLRSRVGGLRIGADDYLAKPFEYEELLARLEAIGRRLLSMQPQLCRGDLTLVTATRRLRIGTQEVRTTPLEYRILHALLSADGGVVGFGELLELAWDDGLERSRGVVKTAIHSLRQKIGPERIVTESGHGYRIP